MLEVVKAHTRRVNGKMRKIAEHHRERDAHKRFTVAAKPKSEPVAKVNHSGDKFSITIRNATPAKAMKLSSMLNSLGVEFSVNQ